MRTLEELAEEFNKADIKQQELGVYKAKIKTLIHEYYAKYIEETLCLTVDEKLKQEIYANEFAIASKDDVINAEYDIIQHVLYGVKS